MDAALGHPQADGFYQVLHHLVTLLDVSVIEILLGSTLFVEQALGHVTHGGGAQIGIAGFQRSTGVGQRIGQLHFEISRGGRVEVLPVERLFIETRGTVEGERLGRAIGRQRGIVRGFAKMLAARPVNGEDFGIDLPRFQRRRQREVMTAQLVGRHASRRSIRGCDRETARGTPRHWCRRSVSTAVRVTLQDPGAPVPATGPRRRPAPRVAAVVRRRRREPAGGGSIRRAPQGGV